MRRIWKCPGRWVRIAAISAVWLTALNLLMGMAQQGSSSSALSGALNTTSNPAFEETLKALHSKDSYERHRAILALGKSKNPAAVEPLLEALKDADYFTRSFAAVALGNFKDSRVIDPLIKALEDTNERVRRSAAESLGTIGDLRALDPLVSALKDKDLFMQRSAALALGVLGAPESVEPLIQVLRSEDSYVWNGAYDALIQIGAPGIPKLVDQLGDWTLGPRIAAVLNALGWLPSSDAEKVRFDVALRNKQALLQNWEISYKTLAADAKNGNRSQLENAVYAFLAIGKEESLEDLKGILQEKGTLEIAKAFIGSGKAPLSEFAAAWAKERGMKIQSAEASGSVLWGSM